MKSGSFLFTVWLVLPVLAGSCQQNQQPDNYPFQGYRRPDGSRLVVQTTFNHNQLLGVQPVADGLVALTQAGSLIKFDLEMVRVIAERDFQPGYRCISHDCHGNVIAAKEDGTIDRIDPRNLNGRRIAKVPGIPVWIGADSTRKSLVAVLGRWFPGYQIENFEPGTVWDIAAQKAYELPRYRQGGATTFFIDNNQNLWIGADHGEFGAWCERLNLHTGEMTPIEFKDWWSTGIYGFHQLRDGTIIAYGGMIHFAATSYIGKIVDNSKLEKVFASDGLLSAPTTAPSSPVMPVTGILHEPNSRDLIVVAYSEVYRVDELFSHWQHLSTLSIDYAPGRPDAMGFYPAVASAQALDGGDRLRLIFGTRGNGIVEIDQRQVIPHEIEHDVPRWEFPRMIGASADGVLLTDGGIDRDATRYWLDRDLHVQPLKRDDPQYDSRNDAAEALWTAYRAGLISEKVSAPGGVEAKVWDSVDLRNGSILVATDRGIFQHIAGQQQLRTSPFWPPTGDVSCLCRDQRGRIWAAGDGLWLLDSATKLWDKITELQLSKLLRVRSMQPWGEDGVALLLSNHRIVTMRLQPAE
jgi:hypothetical protein